MSSFSSLWCWVDYNFFILSVAPLCFLYHEPSRLYQIFREMYVRFFFRLHSISSHASVSSSGMKTHLIFSLLLNNNIHWCDFVCNWNMYVLQASLKRILGNSNLDIFVFCVNVSCCYLISYALKQYSSHFMKDFFFWESSLSCNRFLSSRSHINMYLLSLLSITCKCTQFSVFWGRGTKI